MTTLAEQLERLAAQVEPWRSSPDTKGRTLADVVADLIAALRAEEEHGNG